MPRAARRVESSPMANPVIFPGSTKSVWTFTKEGTSLGMVHLFTSDGASRVDLVNPPDDNVVMIGRDGKVWRREKERDIDLGTMRFTKIVYANIALPLLLLPHTTRSDDRIELLNGLLLNYFSRFGKGTYQKDVNKVPKKIDVFGHGMNFVLERQSVEEKQHDPSIFAIRA
jgi:hypothetical protein